MAGGDWKEMMSATEGGDLELVRYYIKKGLDINYLHPEVMSTPLIESIRFGHVDIARLLLENGADPDIVEGFSRSTAMSVAKSTKNKDAIALLKSYSKRK